MDVLCRLAWSVFQLCRMKVSLSHLQSSVRHASLGHTSPLFPRTKPAWCYHTSVLWFFYWPRWQWLWFTSGISKGWCVERNRTSFTFVVVKVETDPRRKLKVDLEFLKYLPPKNFLFPFEQNLLIGANQPDRYGHNKCLFDQNYCNFLSITKLCSSCTA